MSKFMFKIPLLSFALVCFTLPLQAHDYDFSQNQVQGYKVIPSGGTVIHHHYYNPVPLGVYNHGNIETPVRRRIIERYPAQENFHTRTNPSFANALGASLGGFAGSKIGKGSGKLAATAAGTMLGYFVGGRLTNPR